MEDFNSKYSGEQVEELLDMVANGEAGGGIGAETDPIFSASPAASITENKKKEWDNKVDKVSGKQLSTEDFTSVLKEKLEGLSNYNDTEISNAISTLRNDFDKLVSGDTTIAIKTFNEIIAFLEGINDTQDLSSIISSIEQQIASKQDTLISGKNIKTINGYSILGSGNLTITGGGEVGFNAKISLLTPQFNAVLKDSSGHYIEFTFDTTNGAGESVGESITCTYTITRGTNKTTITEKYRYNTKVRFNLDKYLQEGANDIVIKTVGDISGLSTSVGVTYQVVNLSLVVDYDISKVYDLSTKTSAIVEVPYTISGYGTKIMEWYIDGEQLEYVKVDDEVVDVSTTRTKYITISNLQQGTHSLQVRAYTSVNGELFYTDTQYFDLIVYTGVNNNLIISVAATIPNSYGVLKSGEQLKIYDAIQYETYILKFATYSPTAASSTLVDIIINNDAEGTISSSNGIENEFRYIPTSYGSKTLTLKAGNIEYIIPMLVNKTSMNIDEIKNALVLDFSGEKRTNSSPNKDVWSYGNYTGTFTGFKWNNTSGWVNGRLEIDAGSSFGINYAPLAANPTVTGKTIEIEWSTKNVSNDNAVICDFRGDNGVGILITATKVSMISADGVVIETEYKSDENVRVGFVINKANGVANQRLSFIYANGIISRSEAWAVSDNYTSNKQILFTASNEAEISLKSIRIYDAALSHDQMLNNYILYRDSVAEMLEEYDANDVYDEGTLTFSPDKMMRRLPVMIVTGDIPTLENTSDKDTQIVVDIEYYNLQDPTKNFKMVGAAMRPQGTSSMGYPKKNFRIYTEKVDGTILYDHENKVVENKLYAFTENAQPVNCWCLKADYAESSGTHNTGIARLWNNALINAQIDGEYVCRTEAQKAAIAAGYQYDVRTTIDGFPILLFYRPSVDDNLIFIGKYNFNNDKSTESVFGFTGIPGFNNEKMQCWEILNNGNALALFTSTEGFDTGWSEAFESRYPDTKTPYTGDLKAFCEWMSTVTPEDFETQKWEHLNMYMIAAYWVYLMRHAAADQFVKNAMLTSEDGQHFYFILYDNDTINGLINTGRLRISPTDGRQTVDETGSYVFAGHDSRLWNLLEADDEFKNLVSEMDNALYSAGISYANTIKVFDEDQADKWVARVYNQDAQYKYIGPYVEKGIDNLFMLQGKRDLHRKWWLAKRFSIFDAKYVSGTYKSQAIEVKCLNGTPSGQKFTIKAGYPIDYGYGINNIPRSFGIPLNIGDSHTFTTQEVINLGDPLRIYGAPNLAEVDFSQMSDRLAVMNIASVYDDSLKTKLTKLIVGSANKTNAELEEISGLKQAVSLEHLDIQGMTKMSSLDLSNHPYFKTLKAKGSGISSISFAKGAPVEMLELPSSIRVLSLNQLPYLGSDNIIFENISSLQQLNVSSCPNVTNDFEFVYNWVVNKTASNENCSLTMDGVDWSGVSGQKFYQIASLGAISLKGKVVLTDITEAQGILFERVFGNNVFDENAEFYIDAPTTITISGPTSVLEGDSATYVASVYPRTEGTTKFSLPTTRTGCSINANTGVLTTSENGLATSNIVIRATFTSNKGEVIIADKTVSVVKRVYPTNVTIIGNENPFIDNTYAWSTDTTGVTGDMYAEWAITGDVANYIAITEEDLDFCTIEMTFAPVGVVTGSISLILKKVYNDEVVVTDSMPIAAYMEGIIISSHTNAPIQSALYAAGLVANETYSMREEVEKITAAQLLTGTSNSSSIFYAQRNNITHFEEFEYFTGVTEIKNYTFAYCTKLQTLHIPHSVTSIGFLGFYKSNKIEFAVSANNQNYSARDGVLYNKTGETLVCYRKADTVPNYEVPYGVTNLAYTAFRDSTIKTIVLPETVTTMATESLAYNPNLTSVNIPNGVTELKSSLLAECKALSSITIPAGVTKIDSGCFSMCSSLGEIIMLRVTAPTVMNTTFGSSSSSYTGKNTASAGTNTLRIPLNATGYEANYWLDPLQNSSACGFHIHGKLVITSNRSNAQFSVSYTTESGSAKTITANVGTCYINDIKYNTSVTITANAVSGYTWSVSSKTFTYSSSNYTADFNAYIYPTSVVISGKSSIQGGSSETYTADITPSNFDVGVTYAWSLNDSSNASISSSNGNQCTITTNAVDVNKNITLTCIVTTSDGKKVQNIRTIKIITRPNFITATYNVTSTSSATKLLSSEFSVNDVVYMEVDDVEVTPTTSYTFITTGSHSVKFTLLKLQYAFGSTQLISIDFSECDGSIYTNFDNCFGTCLDLTTINWGGCTFPNATTLQASFRYCKKLTSIDLTPFTGAPIIDIESAFEYCENLTTIDLTPLTGINITSIAYLFRKCTVLEEIDLTPLINLKIANVTFGTDNTFDYCISLKKIICPWKVALVVDSTTFGNGVNGYTGRNTYNKGVNKLYVPADATGYDSGYWKSVLLNSACCGFTISKTL